MKRQLIALDCDSQEKIVIPLEIIKASLAKIAAKIMAKLDKTKVEVESSPPSP